MAGALLIADLEGIAGVDRIESIVAGSPAYAAAQRALAQEVDTVVRALLARGFDSVVVSDSHRAGTDRPNLPHQLLHPAAELVYRGDPYGADLFDGADLIACLGMHAAAGTRGFVAHTVDVHCGWHDGRRWLSESDLVMELAAEAGKPLLFITGDDVLAESIGTRVPYLVSKRAVDPTRARSRDPAEVRRALAALVTGDGVRSDVRLAGPLLLTFKSVASAALAEAAGGARVDARSVEVGGTSVRGTYDRAVEIVEAAAAPMVDAVRGRPGDAVFVDDVTALLTRKLGCAVQPVVPGRIVERLYAAFDTLTAGEAEESLALRALVLTVLSHHAPKWFERVGASGAKAQAMDRLTELPAVLDQSVDPDVGLARVDAAWLAQRDGSAHPTLDAPAVTAYVEHLWSDGDVLYAWLIAKLALQLGLPIAIDMPERALQDEDRLSDCYWLTHLFLLDTEYLAEPLDRGSRCSETETLLNAAEWIASEGYVDLAAEVLLCLQIAGEADSQAHAALLGLVLAAVGEDGVVRDEGMDAGAGEMADHATGVALIALAHVAAFEDESANS